MLNTYLLAIASGFLLVVQFYYVLAEIETSHGKPFHSSYLTNVNHSEFSG